MALSSQALSSSFKRNYQNCSGVAENWPNKKIHRENTNGKDAKIHGSFLCQRKPLRPFLSINSSRLSNQRNYYSCSSDESDYFSENENENQMPLTPCIGVRRLSQPQRKRSFVIAKNNFSEYMVPASSSSASNVNSPTDMFPAVAPLDNDASSSSTAADYGVAPASAVATTTTTATAINGPEFSSLPSSDVNARSRCFDYLVGAIDEAWARYCDATSFAEDKKYKSEGQASKNMEEQAPGTPGSSASSDYDSDYKSDATDLTDYESEYEVVNKKSKASIYGNENCESVKIQNLKDRLIKAKNYLQDFVESNDCEDALLFWARWDLVKYATIELVEDDDDDEIIEDTIEDLERGRFFYNN